MRVRAKPFITRRVPLELFLLTTGRRIWRELTKESFTLAGQGRYISEESIRQIVHLLSSTEMSAREIAERMSCSRSTIFSINRRFGVRHYNGLRSRWSKGDNGTAEDQQSSLPLPAGKKCA